tara:strand:+ start:888 stop:1100 length:213 start_codon:yes stop_codon:yes gene_type:complete
MGSIFRKPKKPAKSQAQIDYEARLARETKAQEEAKAQAEANAKETEYKKAKGLIGSRSLFGNPGGRGFYS